MITNVSEEYTSSNFNVKMISLKMDAEASFATTGLYKVVTQ
jgi:hypothetical protein